MRSFPCGMHDCIDRHIGQLLAIGGKPFLFGHSFTSISRQSSLGDFWRIYSSAHSHTLRACDSTSHHVRPSAALAISSLVIPTPCLLPTFAIHLQVRAYG